MKKRLRQINPKDREGINPSPYERLIQSNGLLAAPSIDRKKSLVAPFVALIILLSFSTVHAEPAIALDDDFALPTHQKLLKAHKLLDDWQLEDARRLSTELLKEEPQNPEIWFLAGRVQHARGEHLAAFELFSAARANGVDYGDRTFELITAAAAYEPHFKSIETPHFSIRYIDKDQIVAELAKPVLESAYREIGKDLGLLPAEEDEKIVVEIYPDARGLAGATGLTLKEIETSGTIAICKFHRLMVTSPLATWNGYDWADTMAHELVHLIISKKSRNNIPIWLHEGIAKYYESRWKGAAGQALSHHSENLLAEAVKTREFVTFDEMHPSMAKLPSQEAAALAFAEVFSVIEFLSKKYGNQSIADILSKTRTGMPLEKALKNTFGFGMKGLEKKWHRWLKSRKFRLIPGASRHKLRLATDESQSKEPAAMEEIEDKEAHDYARLGELLQMRQHPKAAIKEYEKAKARTGLRYITLLNRLARAYQSTGKEKSAIKLLGRALKAHPDDSDAHLMSGRLLLKEGEMQNAKKHFRAVLLRNPFNPEIHAAMSAIYEKEGKTSKKEQSQRFFEMASRRRQNISYDPPTNDPANIGLLAPGWQSVRIDGGSAIATPAFIHLEKGNYLIEFKDKTGESQTRNLSVDSSDSRFVVLGEKR
ncbi:tetratricopeptide repeat protein [Myxococcota bacterium]|nr:tetratricopeptide repeat protein [Myxococcota bacterium]